MKIGKREATKHLGLRVPLALHRQLAKAAVDDRRSLSDEIIVLLEQALAGRK